ncbi:MAG TPA: AAA family ATPase, partial [Caldimonas sp.]|nr:AAA family ATPase [Caldimonas sp.]
MYESTFGIRELPFRLSPDPRFFFGTRGHTAALAQLHRALEAGTGLVVVTGDVGSGKTTLVRAFVGDIDANRFAVAHIVNTQLSSDELMAAIALAFGMPAHDAESGDDASRVLAFLVWLHAQGRQALLFIDEAHNLDLDALDRLVSLVRYGAKRHALQIFLVGQPELEPVIESPQMATLRRHVAVWCRLGPMHADEIRAYIEHRLRMVGWSGNPAFGDGAFDEIYQWTQGVPRNVNVLCNRLLLSRLLASQNMIDVATVRATAHEWRTEMATTTIPSSALPVVHLPDAVPAVDGEPAPRPREPAVARRSEASEPSILCVVAMPGDYLRCAALSHALQAKGGLPRVRIARLRGGDDWHGAAALFRGLRAVEDSIAVTLVTHREETASSLEVSEAVGAVADRVGAVAVAVFGDGQGAAGSSAAARARGLALLRITGPSDEAEPVGSVPAEGWADAVYVPDEAVRDGLVDAGWPADRTHVVGSLVADAVRIALEHAAPSASHVVERSSEKATLRDRSGYALVVLEHAANLRDRKPLLAILGVLREVNRDIRLVWPIRTSLAQHMQRHRVHGILGMEGVLTLPVEDYVSHVRSIRDATCVLTDSWDVQEEATVLRVPCMTIGAIPANPLTVTFGTNTMVGCDHGLATRVLWDCIFNGGKRRASLDGWDGMAGARVVEHLAGWLPERVMTGAAHLRADRSATS